MKKVIYTFILIFSIQFSIAQNAAEIKLKLEKLNKVGAVLYIAAHPDDENTRLLAYLANELKVRTAYLSLTRGDGGQNLIGTEQSEKLGMIRTQELLAARKVDGAEQFFTRAFDFGFSKNPEETLNFWNKDSIIADMVWVIRKFQPDIIITRFPTDGSGGHGHHTASAILAELAMDAAADPSQYKEQLAFVNPWKVKRLVWNGFNFGGRPQSDGQGFTKLEIGNYNALLGKSYGEIASQSRSQHKSQGFGVPMQRGSTVETFKFIKGDSVKTSIFNGIDFSWSRIQNSQKIRALIAKINKEFDANIPSSSIPSLVQLETELKTLNNDYWKSQKIREVQELIFACAGIFAEVTAINYYVTPSSTIKINIQAINRSAVNVKLNTINISNVFDTTVNVVLENNKLISYISKISIPPNQLYSNPYWLLENPSKGMFHVANQENIGKAFNDVAIPVKFSFTIAGKEYSITKEFVYKWTDPVKGELYRNVEVLPIVDLSFPSKNLIFTNAISTKKVQVVVHTNKENVKGEIKLKVPEGWDYSPKNFPFECVTTNASVAFDFDVFYTNANPSTGNIEPIVEIDGKSYYKSVERIIYDHIPTQVQVKNAGIKVEKINIQIKGKKAGYIAGAGDEVPEALKNIGFEVTMLNDENLANKDLSEFDVIVAGIRLYNTNENMQAHYAKLMKYVENGGNYIVQYNTSNFISSVTATIGPYPFQIGRDRVTDEHAEMKFVSEKETILNYPNKITTADFDNWVQERGLYFVSKIDDKYSKVFVCNDATEKPNDGILITCKYGKGVFTYTGISFFRQLPAGVPGAYRLFANIVSQTK
jgi:LmbE family N-acetylglucosaminyl deacetylase